jgi:hypothetical protein
MASSCHALARTLWACNRPALNIRHSVRYTPTMPHSSTLPDPLALTPDNLWVAVYRDRMRGGVGYEFIVTSPGSPGRALAHEDPTTLLALSLSELSSLLQTLAQSPPLRAPGALSWLPIGMGRHVVWSQSSTPSAQLVLARSASDAADLMTAQGLVVTATTDLCQLETIVREMRDILQGEQYTKILSDLRPEAGGFGENWLDLKKDPVQARIAALCDALELADNQGTRDPAAAQELLDILSEGGPPPPIPELLASLDYHLKD